MFEDPTTIEVVRFVAWPWISWSACRGSYVRCGKCGHTKELVLDKNSKGEGFLAPLRYFIANHLHETAIDRPRRSKTVKAKVAQEAPTVEPPVLGEDAPKRTVRPSAFCEPVTFPPNNHIHGVVYSREEGSRTKIKAVALESLPAGITFEVCEADIYGVWMRGPGYGGDPYGDGPIRVWWRPEGQA